MQSLRFVTLGLLTAALGCGPSKSDDKGVKAEQYRVHIRQFGGKCVVQVLNKDGAAENSQTTKRIVSLLHEQLK